jgi:4-amino-4-deoxy-L-arabinose transferase-like glycosyltransferase
MRSLPRAIWPCIAIAIASAWIWSFTTPMFHPPDEAFHTGYVKYLVEAGKIPRRPDATPPKPVPPPELVSALRIVRFSAESTPPFDPALSRRLERGLSGRVGRIEESTVGPAANNPPLYYLYEALPYLATRSANLFDRMTAMRLVSSLLAGLTVAFTFLFVRELLPRQPWAWTLGALAVALQPVFGFVSGSINPDGLLWVASAAVLLAGARIFRRGLSWRRAGGMALALAIGLATKGAMLGLVPGAAIVLTVAAWRLAGTRRRKLLVAGAAAAIAVAVPVLAWVLLTGQVHGTVSGAGTTGGVTTSGVDLKKEVGYVWQTYLPRLPFQDDQFEHYPLWDVYFKGFVGRFGHFLFGFPDWVNWLALAIALGAVALAGRALWLGRGALRGRLGELASYAGTALGLLLLLGVAGYQYKQREGIGFEQTRYLLPLLPLYGALIALAARGAGRFARPVAVGFVGLAAAQELFSLLLTIAHYYG